MACRCCEAALKRNGVQTSNIAKLTSRRSFSSGTRYLKNGGLPIFGETSSPELDSVLSTLRYKVFLPNAHLNQQQRKLVFREKYRSQLETQPVKVTIGDEEVELVHMDQLNLPNTWDLTKRVFALLSKEKQAKDWHNVLPNLMHGFQGVRFGLSPARMEKMVRTANSAEMQDVVMKCLQQVKTTNLSLKWPGIRYEVLWGIHAAAQNGGTEPWGEQETKQAIGWMKQVAIQLESRIHGGGFLNDSHDPRASPAVIGLLLELYAARASQHMGGVDMEGKVRIYAERLMDVLPRWRDDYFADAPHEGQKLVFQVILYQALNLAQRVLGADMPQAEAATKRRKSLGDLIQKQLNTNMMEVKPQYCVMRMKETWEKRIQKK
ncbi:hypothetical protein EV356DRAFT_575398 [Viridothelium virens]|uniref:Uncharacterized protein n=1 Tax=Viridothelium virens TaxID=1048519 RepID=A0A6A6HCM2_VIRVR|nr:hypothetical protein EV356DRAFT_575398 [Viridothelium virens]